MRNALVPVVVHRTTELNRCEFHTPRDLLPSHPTKLDRLFYPLLKIYITVMPTKPTNSKLANAVLSMEADTGGVTVGALVSETF